VFLLACAFNGTTTYYQCSSEFSTSQSTPIVNNIYNNIESITFHIAMQQLLTNFEPISNLVCLICNYDYM
jgi:hypothetical protein